MHAFANFITKRYRFIIIFWSLLIVLSAIFALKLPSLLQGDGFRMDGEHEEVMNIASQKFDFPADTMFLTFDNVNDSTIKKQIELIDKLSHTSEIISPLDEDDFYSDTFSYALLHFNDDTLDMSKVVSDIRNVIKNESIILTGQAPLTQDINRASQKDLLTAEAFGLPAALIILLIAFGTLVASVIPLLIGISSVVVSFGILALIGDKIDLSIFVLNIVPMLGLALSIDFALLLISRYREERINNDINTSIITTLQTAGRSVLFSAFCVFIGLGAMFFIQVDIFQNIALGGMIVVSLAVLSSITLLPSLLIIIGERIEKGKIFKQKKGSNNKWRTFANAVIKRPIIISISAVTVLLIALIPIKDMELTIPELDALPLSYDSRQAFENMEDTFNLNNKTSVFIVAENKNGWDNENGFEEILDLTNHFKKDDSVESVSTVFEVMDINNLDEWNQIWHSPMKTEQIMPVWNTFVNKNQLIIPINLALEGSSDEAQEWVKNINNNDINTQLIVGGEPKFNQEIFDEIKDKILTVLLVIIISTFIVLMIAFRSLLIPIKAILMNIIGLGATFGILVYIFQYGHFGITAGTIALIIPVIVFSLVFGLSMDYEVFLISRMQEEYAKTLDNDHATVEGLAVTSKIITSAALIMIVLTGAFAFTDVMPVKQIGVGIAIAIALDATIIRLLLVPSLMKLLGKWNWWLPFRKGSYTAGKPK